jgi:hypothetical protein
MPAFAIQYLEESPEIASITPQQARNRLRAAFQALPISYVLIGWHLPDAVLDACAEETARAGAQFYRWHPLLTGDGAFVPRPEWRGANGLALSWDLRLIPMERLEQVRRVWVRSSI